MGLLFRVLGPVSLYADGVSHSLRRPQARGVLGFLLLNTARVVPVELVIDALWAGAEPPTARNQVQSAVSAIRRLLHQLGDTGRLVSDFSGYRMLVHPSQVDLAV